MLVFFWLSICNNLYRKNLREGVFLVHSFKKSLEKNMFLKCCNSIFRMSSSEISVLSGSYLNDSSEFALLASYSTVQKK